MGEEVVFFQVADLVHFVFFVLLIGGVRREEHRFEFSACEEHREPRVKAGQLGDAWGVMRVETDMVKRQDVDA